jgi:hypothetical protein
MIFRHMAYVLVVDDEEAIRRLLMRWLAGWGYEAREAAGAEAAIEMMAEEPADIMLCDVMMPVHDGIWLAEQVRGRCRTRRSSWPAARRTWKRSCACANRVLWITSPNPSAAKCCDRLWREPGKHRHENWQIARLADCQIQFADCNL